MNSTNPSSPSASENLLSETQLATLRAAMNRLIPPDDFPGAWDAGAGNYILHQLAHGDLQNFLPTYRDGLDALDREARQRTGQAFVDLSPGGQDALLHSVEKGDIATNWATLQRFLDSLIKHTAEGYYADPGNGGNRGAISWQMIGFRGGDRTLADYDWPRPDDKTTRFE